MAARGKPAYDETRASQICSALSEGVFLKDAAALVGVSEATVHLWLDKGRRGKAPYAQFASDVSHARAQFVYLTLKEIREVKVNGGDWKRLAWWLAKLRPADYGDLVRVHVEREQREVLNRLKEGLSPAVYEQVVGLIAGDAGDTGGAASSGEE
jgi:hypothetical protein